LGGILDFLKGLGAPRLVAMLAVTLSLIGFFGFVAMRVSDSSMVPVFTDLSIDDSSSIIKDLERQGIQYVMKNDGAIIMVPKDNVARLRMKLAEAGLPKGGGVGY
jgi:flagellar M-ring protein FliF